MDRPAAPQGECGKTSLLNFQESKVCLFMDSDKSCLNDPLLARRRNLIGKIHGSHGERHVNPLRPLDHVGVRHDVALRIHDHPRTDHMLLGDDCCLTATTLARSAIAGDHDLNYGRGNPGGELLNRGIELLQYRLLCRARSHCLGFVRLRLGRFATGYGGALRPSWLAKARRGNPQAEQARSHNKKRVSELMFRTAINEAHGDSWKRGLGCGYSDSDDDYAPRVRPASPIRPRVRLKC